MQLYELVDDWTLVDYANIIFGIIGASEHQKLCWHSRYTFLISWLRALHANL